VAADGAAMGEGGGGGEGVAGKRGWGLGEMAG